MRILSIVTRPVTAPRVPTQDEIDRMGALVSELTSDGSLVDMGGTWPGMLEMQIPRRAGDYSLVAGPVRDAQEVVGGYLLLEVPDREAAIALTRRFLDVSGDGTCHLLQIVERPPDQA